MTALLKLTMMAVLLTVLPLHLEALPTKGITSQEVGQAAEQIRRLLMAKMMQDEAMEQRRRPTYNDQAKEQYGRPPYNNQAKANQFPLQGEAQHNYYDQAMEQRGRPYNNQAKATERARAQQIPAQVSGIDIENCGLAGDIVESSLSILEVLFPGQFGVLVDCQFSPDCVLVRVDVPPGNIKADIDVCSNPVCVEVYAASGPCNVSPITINVPLPGGQEVSVEVRVSPGIAILGIQGCASVQVNAPSCP